MCVCVCRLAGGDPALSELVRRRDELAIWCEQAETAVTSLPVTATDKNLKELKVQRGSENAQVSAIHRGAEISVPAPELDRLSYFYGQLQLCCIFPLFFVCFTVLTSCSLHSLTRKKCSKPANLHRNNLTLTCLVLNDAFFFRVIQSLIVFLLHSFQTTTSARLLISCETV